MKRFLNLTVALLFAASVAGSPAVSGATFKPRQRRSVAPTAYQIVERFVQAVGGRDAWLRVTSQYAKGTVEIAGVGVVGTFDFYGKAPDRSLVIIKLGRAGEFRSGFDGQRGWHQNPRAAVEYEPESKQRALKRDADFYKYVHFREHFTKAEVVGVDSVRGESAYVVEATPAGETVPERLYFGVKTGLLLRRDTRQSAEARNGASATYYADYREVGGVKVAYTVESASGGVNYTFRTTEERNNVEIDDSLFDPLARKDISEYESMRSNAPH